MSTNIPQLPQAEIESKSTPKVLVCAFIDGFNLYHALQNFTPAVPVSDPDRYRKYKWLCLTSLVRQFLRPQTELLAGVKYFTALPNWPGSEQKRVRHELYISVQKYLGVEVILGKFKPHPLKCQATCKQPFEHYVEKETDINVSTKIIEYAHMYDKALLITADSDQVPTIKLFKHLYPEKKIAVIPPIGRGSKELSKASDESFKMTESHLINAQLPDPLEVPRPGLSPAIFAKPNSWRL